MNDDRLATWVELYSPESEVEGLLLRSVLDGAGIHYFVKNDTFAGLVPGPRIALCNRRIFLVPEEEITEARHLLEELLDKTTAPEPQQYPLREKIRMVFEVLFFGWFLPGRRGRRTPPLRLVHSAAPSDDEPPRRTPDERSPTPRRGPPESPPLRLVHPHRTPRRQRRSPRRSSPERADPAPASAPDAAPASDGAEDRTPPD